MVVFCPLRLFSVEPPHLFLCVLSLFFLCVSGRLSLALTAYLLQLSPSRTQASPGTPAIVICMHPCTLAGSHTIGAITH
jgi:hypothetical protein